MPAISKLMVDFNHSFFMPCINNPLILGLSVAKNYDGNSKQRKDTYFDEVVGHEIVNIPLLFNCFFLRLFFLIDFHWLDLDSIIYFNNNRCVIFNSLMTLDA